MIINDKNRDKISRMIVEAEGKASVRTITYEDILRDINEVESEIAISKKTMLGVSVDVDHHAHNFPAAYKYPPVSTHYTIIRMTRGWDLVRVSRETTRREGHRFSVTLTESAKTAIIKRLSDF